MHSRERVSSTGVGMHTEAAAFSGVPAPLSSSRTKSMMRTIAREGSMHSMSDRVKSASDMRSISKTLGYFVPLTLGATM